MSEFGLTPEHLDRIRRIAKARGQTPAQVLSDAITILWVRFAAEQRLKPKDW
jgi:hypothetical protein